MHVLNCQVVGQAGRVDSLSTWIPGCNLPVEVMQVKHAATEACRREGGGGVNIISFLYVRLSRLTRWHRARRLC